MKNESFMHLVALGSMTVLLAAGYVAQSTGQDTPASDRTTNTYGRGYDSSAPNAGTAPRDATTNANVRDGYDVSPPASNATPSADADMGTERNAVDVLMLDENRPKDER